MFPEIMTINYRGQQDSNSSMDSIRLTHLWRSASKLWCSESTWDYHNLPNQSNQIQWHSCYSS